MRTSVVSEGDVRLHRNSSGEGVLCVGEEVMAHLACHHHPQHTTSAVGSGNVVLMRAEAGLVLDTVALEEGADPQCIHASQILGRDGSDLARVVWFKPHVADKIAGLRGGTFQSAAQRLRRWGEQQQSDPVIASIQPASGVYISVGSGILPGHQRECVHLDGEGTLVPFSRAPHRTSDEIEPTLGILNSATAECLLAAFADMEEWCVSTGGNFDDCSECDDWLQVCQYPATPPGMAHTIPSHQVVVRGHLSGVNACASGADLHIDKMDGGYEFGGCCTFFGNQESQSSQWRDFAIFDGGKTGGRGAAVRVLSEDWICALCCRYKSCLHGTVFEDDPGIELPEQRCSRRPEMEGMHVVSYNLRNIETFVDRIGNATAVEQREVIRKLDDRLRRIALRKVWVASHMVENDP